MVIPMCQSVIRNVTFSAQLDLRFYFETERQTQHHTTTPSTRQRLSFLLQRVDRNNKVRADE